MSRRLISSLAAFAAFALAASFPTVARAYDEEVHTFLVRSSLAASGLDAPAPAIDPAAAARVREAIDGWARTSSDAAVRAEWVRRYPRPESFDAWAEKELLLFSPKAQVFGIDRFPEKIGSLLDAVEIGAREPDDDRRNRDRFAYDAKREKLKDASGRDVPADPAILNMGKLGALSSQAHAHYGLADVQFSDDPDVLKNDPRRFAVAAGYPKGPILTLAAEMAEEHLDLALIAALGSGGDASPTLAWLYTGQAFHYLEDVSNQIHTVQVGIYDFFVDAMIDRIEMAARTGGGYLAPLRSLSSIGIDILTNHHVISEKLTKKRTLEANPSPEGKRLIEAPRKDDPDFVHSLDGALAPLGPDPSAASFGFAMTKAMIDVSSKEGADVYRATRAIADPRFRKEGVLYDEDKDDPDASILPVGKRDAAAYENLIALQVRAFSRAGTAMRRWVALEQQAFAAHAPEVRARIIGRLVRRQLALLSAAEARRADDLANPRPSGQEPDRMTWLLVVELIALAAILVGISRVVARVRAAGSGG